MLKNAGQTREKTLKPASTIAYEKHLLEIGIHEGEEIRNKISEAKNPRIALVKEFEANGLKVVLPEHENIHDNYATDDGGNLIDTVLRVNVKTEEEVVKAIRLANHHQFGVMPIGSKTSALSVFDVDSLARQKGLQKVIGLELIVNSPNSKLPELLQVDENNIPTGFELIKADDLPVAVLKSKNFPSIPHRVISHVSATVDQVNGFLNEVLREDKYNFQIMADPTSKADATLGGVISCGAEGGNRMSAAHDIQSLKIIDANGEIHILDREEAQKQVGLNGTAGMCMEASFEVTALPKNHFGFFIPINGSTSEQVWQNVLKLQNKLSKYSKVQAGGCDRVPVKNEGDILITAMEVLAKKEVKNYVDSHDMKGKDDLNKLLADDNKLYVYIRAASLNGIEDLFYANLAKDLGIQIDENEEIESAFMRNSNDGTDSILQLAEGESHDKAFYFFDENIFESLDRMRHMIAEEARKEAKTLGGISQSTDFNIRFTGETEDDNTEARRIVAEIYARYVDRFDHDEAFEVAIYGHLFNGFDGVGGGMDPHIRITFRANESSSRYSSPEKIAAMKKSCEEFYKELLTLNGKCGISVERPEKSLLTNKTYFEWLCLEHPEKVEEAQEMMKKYGYSKEGSPTFAFRNGFELPGMPRTLRLEKVLDKNLIAPGSANGHLIDKYWKAILEISQKSHRSPEIKGIFGDVSKVIREKFKLNHDQYPFFIERKDEAHEIIKRNLGRNHNFKIKEIDLASLDNLNFSDSSNFYIIDLEKIGVPKGLTLLITPHKAVQMAEQRNKSGENKAKFRNLYTMWKMQPYETEETPNIPAVALLGLILERDSFRDENFSSQNKITTVNPGPSIIDSSIINDGSFYLGNAKEMNPNLQLRILNDFKQYLGLSQDYDMAFTASATQMMQNISDAIENKRDSLNLIQVTNDAFSERFNSILDNGANTINTLTTPWTSSEKSELAKVILNILEGWDDTKKNLIVLTPHKTSTTASFDPNIIIEELEKAGKKHKVDFELICDITSGVGAINYQNEQGLGCVFGSVQKGLACPPGLGFAAFSPSLMKSLFNDEDFEEKKDYSLEKLIYEAREGQVHNNLHLSMLGHKINADKYRGFEIEEKVKEIREKFEVVLGFLSLHPELSLQVADSIDRSPVLAGIYSQTKNLVVAKRLLNDLFNFELGSGYGVYVKESVRLYLANIPKEKLREMFIALHYILELPEVSESTDKTAPVVTLREPFDPLSVLSRLSDNLEPNDIYENESGLSWLERLVNTYNSNVLNNNWLEQKGIDLSLYQPIKVNGIIPERTSDFDKKAAIYGDIKNIEEMRKILRRQDDKEHGSKSLISYYETYAEQERVLRMMLEKNPDKEMSAYLETVIEEMKQSLSRIVILLNQYINEEDCKYIDDRVAWPYTA